MRLMKQKAALLMGIVGILTFPSAAHATETEIKNTTQESSAQSALETSLIPERLNKPSLFTTSATSLENSFEEVLSARSEAEMIPLGEAIVEAARAQLGIHQDCTDMVQNALAAVGVAVRRDAGGYDYGTNIAEHFGYEVPWTEAQPGDIAWHPPTNGGHVWVVLDPETNLGIHGGMQRASVGGDGWTIISTYQESLSSATVIRISG